MPDGAASQRGEGSQDPGSGGGEGRPRSLLRPRNPTTGRAADDRILSVREGESPAVPSRPSIVLYFGGLSFSSPSVLPTLPMHTQTPPNRLSSMGTLEPLSTQPTRWRTAWSINPKGHPLSLPLKSLSAEGQTVLSGGTFSEVPEETTQDNPNGQQDGQRAAGSGQQTDRSRPDRPLRQTPEAFWHLASRSKRDEPETGLNKSQPRHTTQLFGWLHLCYIYIHRQVATAKHRARLSRHGQMPKSQWKRPWTRGRRSTLAPTSIPKCKGFCTPRRANLGRDGCRVPCLCFCAIQHRVAPWAGAVNLLIGFPFPPCCLFC